MNENEDFDFPLQDPAWDYYEIWSKIYKQSNAVSEVLVFLSDQKNNDLIIDIQLHDKLQLILKELESIAWAIYGCPPGQKCPSCGSEDITENETFRYFRCHSPYCHTAWLDKNRHPTLRCFKVLGLDVSKSSVAVCLLSDKPIQPRQFYYEYAFLKLQADVSGIRQLLELQPDVALMEPTGNNYSKLWGVHLARAGVEVRLVGHKELKYYRSHQLGLPDKDDDADALALACYYFDYPQDPRRFVQIRDETIVKIRELVLRLAHLNRVQSPIINRIRQDLAWQFPEVALVRSRRGESGEVPLLWGWLCGIRQSKKYDRLYQNTAGLGITDTVQYHAQRICDLQVEEFKIEKELVILLSDSRLAPSLESSGDKHKSKVIGGSDLCRKAFWQWVFTRIEPKRSRIDNQIGKYLGEILDKEKAAGRPVKLVRMKVAAHAARLLFRELVKLE